MERVFSESKDGWQDTPTTDYTCLGTQSPSVAEWQIQRSERHKLW